MAIIFAGLIGISLALIAWLILPVLEARVKQGSQMQAVKMAQKLDEMNIQYEFRRLKSLYFILPLIFGPVAYYLYKDFIAVIAAVAVSLFLPNLVLMMMMARNRLKFNSQLVDSLNVISSCLKAGLTLPQSFEVVAEEMSPPSSVEFQRLSNNLRMGIPLEEALMRMRKRVKSEEFDLVVISILVARDTGGNVTEIFNNLISTVREKAKIKKKTQVLTAQARLQAFIIVFLPLLFVPFVLQQNPKHFDIFFKDPTGQALLMSAVFLNIIGVFLILRLGRSKL